jgi:hypothetical protein
VNEESIIDLLEFRKEILYLIKYTPRYSIVPISNDTEGNLNNLVIDIIIIVVRYYMGS